MALPPRTTPPVLRPTPGPAGGTPTAPPFKGLCVTPAALCDLTVVTPVRSRDRVRASPVRGRCVVCAWPVRASRGARQRFTALRGGTGGA